jgi:hypothetical protein
MDRIRSHIGNPGVITAPSTKIPVPGKAVFERDEHSPGASAGAPMSKKRAVDHHRGSHRWQETYGSGAFPLRRMPKDGKIVIDFNKAYLTRRALFTPYASIARGTAGKSPRAGRDGGRKKNIAVRTTDIDPTLQPDTKRQPKTPRRHHRVAR